MNNVLARFGIRYQLLLLGLIGVVGMAACAGINRWSDIASDRLNVLAARVRAAEASENQVRIAVLGARRYEKDYLLRPKDDLPVQHGRMMVEAERAVDALSGELSERPDEVEQAHKVRRLMLDYVDAFDVVQNDVQVLGMTEDQGLQGQLRTSVHNVEDRLGAMDLPSVKVAMLMMRRHEKDFMLRLDPKYGAMVKERLPEFTAALDAGGLPDDTRASMMERMTSYQDTFGRFLRATLLKAEDEAKLNTSFDALERELQALDARLAALVAADDAALAAQVEHTRALVLASLAVTSGLVMVLSLLIGRGIARPITAITRSMDALVRGNLDAAVPTDSRRDEVGTMIRAVHAFKESLITTARLHEQQSAQQEQAEAAKLAALVNMADRIEQDASAAVIEIGERTAAMTTTADDMHEVAARTGESAQTALDAAGVALRNAQAVAAAADELAASIREIGGQVGQSAAVVRRAVEAGIETRATIEALNERVSRIGAVTGVIGEIAARTNLLALNATIEAARAGEAGRGFAVVAGEVKQLATQTARSTGDITQQLSEVRSATQAAVEAVTQIETTIAEVNEIAASIAAGVEQQGAATAEIARRVSETASVVNEMADRNGDAAEEAQRAGHLATAMAESTKSLDTAVDALRHAIIRTVRTSTSDVDRRLDVRQVIDEPCRAEITGGSSEDGRVLDISPGGARLAGLTSLRPGLSGRLRLGCLTVPLAFTVRKIEDGVAHVAFEADEHGNIALRDWIGALAEKQAA